MITQLWLWLLLLTVANVLIDGVPFRNNHKKRCRTTDDLGRIPWFLPKSTFHNFGFPLFRTLCETTKHASSSYQELGCVNASSIAYLYESERDLRSGLLSSTIIVDPHMMQGLDAPSSGSYVIMAMFELLLDLGYQPGVRHWSEGMNNMFPPQVAAAATKLSRQYDDFIRGTEENPYATTPNVVMLQIEVPYGFTYSVPVNTSPYGRTYQWMIGLHRSHTHAMYQHSDPASHCTGANFFIGRGHLCTTSEVISCPQYDFHRTRSLEITPETRKSLKKNIILFDDDQEELDMQRLKTDVMKLGGLDDLQVLKNQGRRRSDMPDLYKTVKMTIDCRNPGVEFINYEATLYDVMTLSCDMRATRNVFDFPVPSKYHINPRNWTHLVRLIHDSMINYEERIDDFKHFKRLSRSSNGMARKQVDMHYFSRDVLFRTYCESYAECRRVYPWAVAVWTLYPMAMIEVITELNLLEESLESDVVRMTLSSLFTSKYFKMYNSVPGVAPVDMFPRTPCAYMVYMDASFIPFGRDFLNTHVAALVKDPRPIVYWQGDKIAIAVMHARPYSKVVVLGGKVPTTYMELNYVIHPVPNREMSVALTKAFGAPETVDASYLARFATGEPFLQGHLDEMFNKDLPLRSRPCDNSLIAASSSQANPTPTAVGPNASLRRRATSITSTNSHRPLPSHTSRAPPAASVRHPVSPRPLGPGQPVAHPASVHGAAQPQSPQLHLRKQKTSSFGTFRPRCEPQEHLIIDAIYVPMPIVGDNADSNAGFSTGPTLWLTSSVVPVPFHTVFDTFDKKQIEMIVQHLDPILQNSYMRKIISLIPSDIADAFKMFDAIDYPNVISLRDMEYPHWGEKCSKV